MSLRNPLVKWIALIGLVCVGPGVAPAAEPLLAPFLEKYCVDCHDTSVKKGGLDLSAARLDWDKADNFAAWVKIYDRVESGEMPPAKRKRPAASETAGFLKSLKKSLVEADRKGHMGEPRTALRRLTRGEYENTIRDLFDMPGIALAGLAARRRLRPRVRQE